MEENENNQNNKNEENKNGKKGKPSKKGVVPTTEIDLGIVAKNASKKWKENTWLTLLWKKEETFSDEVLNYNSVLSARLQDGASRPQVTQALTQLDRKIKDSIIYVKGYILEKYKKEASKSYYASFGFVHKGGGYIFPHDQNNRLEALKRMLEGIEEHGFQDKEYGYAFWRDCYMEYEKYLKLATEKDGAVSLKVGDKNVLKKEIKKVLNAIAGIIKINYPETYREELRNWGFQKEKY